MAVAYIDCSLDGLFYLTLSNLEEHEKIKTYLIQEQMTNSISRASQQKPLFF